MDSFTKVDLTKLIQAAGAPCFSLYLSVEGFTPHKTPAANSNRISLKNLLRQAETKLQEAEYRSDQIRDFLKKAYGLLEDESFWQYAKAGLAIFVSEKIFAVYRLPVFFRETVIFSERFHVRPLLPLVSDPHGVLILALSQNGVRLFRATLSWIKEEPLQNAPKNIEEILSAESQKKRFQFHTPAPQGKGYYSQGVQSDETKKNLIHYFQRIEESLVETLKNDETPLLLYGVNFLLPLFRETSRYRNILQEEIHGNPDRENIQEIHQRSLEKLPNIWRHHQHKSLQKYEHSLSAEQTSSRIEDILPAAFAGRVDILFVANGAEFKGIFNRKDRTVLLQSNSPVKEDLLDLALEQTLLHGGEGLLLDHKQMPEGSIVAAVYRY